MNQLMVKDEKSLSLPWDRSQVDLIKRTIAKDATDDELMLFGLHCQKTGLDPLAKQIFFQKRKSHKTGDSTLTFITSIDGFRLIAARTGEHAGTDDAIFDNEKEPNKATVTVYRIVKGEKAAFTASARWDEYCPAQGMDFMWRKMPCTMLAKCAESLALRKAFPNELSNMYTNEEMAQSATPSQETPRVMASSPTIGSGASETQRRLAWEKTKELGYTDEQAKAFLAKTSGKTHSSQWTADDFTKVMQKISELQTATTQTSTTMTPTSGKNEAELLEDEALELLK